MGAWGDPSHVRVISAMTLSFLSQEIYKRDIGVTTMSDFKGSWKGDFAQQWSLEEGGSFYFVLKAVK